MQMARALRLALIHAFSTLLLLACRPALQSASSTLPAVVYLGWDESGLIQLFELRLGDETPNQLTQSDQDVTDYSVSPVTGTIAYVVGGGAAGSEIWLASNGGRQSTVLIDCQTDACDRPVWHPDGRRLVFERRPVDANGFLLPSKLWWLDTATAETIPVLDDPDAVSRGASFSANGQWLSYAGTPDEGIFAYRFDDDLEINVASEMGTPAVWSPIDGAFIVRNFQLVVLHSAEGSDHQSHGHDFAQAVHLFLVNVQAGTNVAISGNNVVDDSAPAWSPDGNWVAFTRKLPRTQMGGQLWRMRPDGSDAHALTDEPEFSHGAPAWSPDGRFVLFQRFAVLDDGAFPEIWSMEFASGKMKLISESGFRASWRPTPP